MFDKIIRKKVRFQTPKGLLSIEDVWDLPLTSTDGANLDDLAKSLNRQLKEEMEESFVKEKSQKSELLQLMFDAVIYIIKTKLKEQEEAEMAVKKKQQKEKIMRVIQDKEEEQLKSMDVSELKKLLNEL